MVVQGYEAFQEVRIAQMNNIRDVIRKLIEGIPFDAVEEKKETKTYQKKYTDKELEELFKKLLDDNKIDQTTYDFISDCWILVKGGNKTKIMKCPECKKTFEDKERIQGVNRIENEYKKLMKSIVEDEPIYKVFLSKIRGIGEVLSAKLIKAFGNCETYKYESRLRVHTGNHVVNGVAPKRRKGETINYNPKLRTLTWNVSESLMKINKGYYRKVYDEEKVRQSKKVYDVGFLAQHYNGYKEEDTQLSKGHCHNRALRKMREHFLSHYWECSRGLKGLPIEKFYIEQFPQHVDKVVHWHEALAQENCLMEDD